MRMSKRMIISVIIVLLSSAAVWGKTITYTDENGNICLSNVRNGSEKEDGVTEEQADFFRRHGEAAEELYPLIDEISRRYGLDVNLVCAVIKVESNFDCKAVSPAGAQGIMQLMPPTMQRFDVEEPFNCRENLIGGIRYLRHLMGVFSGELEIVLAAYNAGENAVAEHKGIPPFRETRDYVSKVLAWFDYFSNADGNSAEIYVYSDDEGFTYIGNIPPGLLQ